MIRRTPLFSLCRHAMVLAVLIITVLVAVGSAEAGTVTLQWDPNPETDVAGYVVSYGTASGQYTAIVDVGNQLWFQCSEVTPATTYYFAVHAYNTAGAQGPLSSEVHTTALVPTLSLTGISASLPSPQISGTTVTFAAGATGGTVPYQYKWLIFKQAQITA